jgi:hypothetical protein
MQREPRGLKIKRLDRSYDALSGHRPLTHGVAGGSPGDQAHARPPHAVRYPPLSEPPVPAGQTMRWVALAGWLLLLAAIIITGIAQPQTETYYHRRQGIKVESFWNYSLTPYIMVCCLLALGVSAAGLIINLVKSHPKGDFVHINYIILAGLSVVGIVLYLMYLT